MRYVVKSESTGYYFVGSNRHTAGWTPELQLARVFDRVTDAKNSNAFFGGGGLKPVCVPVSLSLV